MIVCFVTRSPAQSGQLTATHHRQLPSLVSSAAAWSAGAYGCVLLVLLLAGLCYYGYHVNKRSNRRLMQQQRDISAKNDSLQLLLREKEWLLREIHHRVKNNLQIVISLLNIQSGALTNEALAAIRRSQDRISAMSLIHHRLYQSEAMALVHMEDYINDLVSQLKTQIDTGVNVQISVNAESVLLGASQAVPVGLILNEAITNALLHSFTGRKQGYLAITLQPAGGTKLQLVIADDGNGLPETQEQPEKSAIGINLIKILTRQLDGEIAMTNAPGLVITITFDVELELGFVTKAPVSQSNTI